MSSFFLVPAMSPHIVDPKPLPRPLDIFIGFSFYFPTQDFPDYLVGGGTLTVVSENVGKVLDSVLLSLRLLASIGICKVSFLVFIQETFVTWFNLLFVWPHMSTQPFRGKTLLCIDGELYVVAFVMCLLNVN